MNQTRNYKENFVFTPLGIAIQLGIVAEGSWGSTRNEIINVVGNEFVDNFTKRKYIDKQSMKIFTIIFHSEPMRSTYSTSIHHKYGTFLCETNFQKKDEALKIINYWISDVTNDSITWSIDPNNFNDQTTFIVSGTLIMKASWVYHFKSTKSIFILTNGKTKTVKSISAKNIFQCSGASIPNVDICEIPLNNPRYTSIVILPHNYKDICKIVNSLDLSMYQRWLHCLAPLKVRVTLPKFSIYTSENIEKYIISNGISKVFTKDANLSLIFPLKSSLDHLTSSTYILVDQDGIISSEQKSNNTINMSSRDSCEPEFEFNVNKPFLFIVHDHKSNCATYCCIILDPTISTLK